MFVAAVAYAYAAWLSVRHAFATDVAAKQRILRDAAGSVMIGFIFAVVHTLLGLWNDGAYVLPKVEAGWPTRWIDSTRPSFSTLTTAGFGDLMPVGQWANMLCALEGIAGILFPATFIERIASPPTAP